MNLAIDFRTGLTRTRVNPKRAGVRRGRVVDPKYLAFIRSLPCVVCLREGPGYLMSGINGGLHPGCVQVSPTEAAHVGVRGMGQKCSDREAIPLCGIEHHREGSESQHKLGKKFFEHHGLDRDKIIAELNAQYELESGSVQPARDPSDVPWQGEAGKTRRRMIAEELYG